MIEMCRLKNVVIFIQKILIFVLSRKIINIYNDVARQYGNINIYIYIYFNFGFGFYGSFSISFPEAPTLYDSKILK